MTAGQVAVAVAGLAEGLFSDPAPRFKGGGCDDRDVVQPEPGVVDGKADLVIGLPEEPELVDAGPMRVQNDVLRPVIPRPVAPEVQRRFDQDIAFEESAVTQLEGLGAAARVGAEAAGEALATISIDEVTVLLGAPLPVDTAGRRVGRPDMLVVARGGGYEPVDIKHHLVLDAMNPGRAGTPALTSPFESPALEDATTEELFSALPPLDDLLQLAHYQRILEAAGLAAGGGRWEGILGSERRIVWFDLDAPLWRSVGADGLKLNAVQHGAICLGV